MPDTKTDNLQRCQFFIVAKYQLGRHGTDDGGQHHRNKDMNTVFTQYHFHHKDHRRQRGIKRRRYRGRNAATGQNAHAVIRQLQIAANSTGTIGAKMHRRAFAANRETAGQCQNAAKKLIQSIAKRHNAVSRFDAVNDKRNTQPVVFIAGCQRD